MSSDIAIEKKELWGQPIGLYILFLTEMWERFSYYGMRAILVLFLVEKTTAANPGLGWTSGNALVLYGWYTMLVYLLCIPGGIIADNWIGQRKAVLVGGIFLVIGHSILAINAMWAFYSGLAFIVMGVGMLKANISTMVGGLYQKEDIRRDKGFTIFYIGINLGALLAAFTVGTVGEKIGWHYGFGLAGIAMAIGLVIYWWGQKYLQGVGEMLDSSHQDENGNRSASFKDLYARLFRAPKQLTISSLLILFSLYWLFFQSVPDGILYLFLSAVVALMLMVYKDLTTRVMKDRFLVIILSFLLVIVFWGAFEQAGGLMSIYAMDKTNRWLGSFEIPATWFQSLNSLYIIIFGVAVANFWTKRKLKNKESSSLYKMGIGTVIMGLGFLFMAGAARQYTPGGEKAGMYWLFLAFLFHTIGELCSSPVALSFITKLSPMKYASLMMGLYFAASGLGNKVAGTIGAASQSDPIKIELNAGEQEISPFLDPSEDTFSKNKDFTISSRIYVEDGNFGAVADKSGKSILSIISFKNEAEKASVIRLLEEKNASKVNPYHADFQFNKIKGAEASQYPLGYSGSFVIQEIQTASEFRTFIGITIFTALFGFLVVLLLKPLKRLTHRVEDHEHAMN